MKARRIDFLGLGNHGGSPEQVRGAGGPCRGAGPAGDVGARKSRAGQGSAGRVSAGWRRGRGGLSRRVVAQRVQEPPHIAPRLVCAVPRRRTRKFDRIPGRVRSPSSARRRRVQSQRQLRNSQRQSASSPTVVKALPCLMRSQLGTLHNPYHIPGGKLLLDTAALIPPSTFGTFNTSRIQWGSTLGAARAIRESHPEGNSPGMHAIDFHLIACHSTPACPRPWPCS